VVDSTDAYRILETSHPPVYYVAPSAIAPGVLEPNPRTSWCEFKGTAHYWDVVAGGTRIASGAWSYPEPSYGYEAIRDHVAFYPSLADACYVDDEQVVPQAGDFYGGWITSGITGPFKGAPGTLGW
jgi:uncharacterized protein (DUF427 family)